jgi:cytochrome c peroxidase
MHDGRHFTLDEVLNHYNTGVKNNITIDPNMKKANLGGLQLPQSKLDQLKAYLLMLNDVDFMKDTSFSNPF